jgi:hypothetical protein
MALLRIRHSEASTCSHSLSLTLRWTMELKELPAQATFRNSLSDLDVNIVRGAVNYKF